MSDNVKNPPDEEDAPKPFHSQHDKTYRLFYSHPEMVEDTLKGFISEPWVHQLDYSTLEKMSQIHVSERLDLRFQDVVWKVRCQGTDIYLCLLIEFQSTIDPYMIFRIFFYVAVFYDDLIRQIREKDLPDPDSDVVVGEEGERYSKLSLIIPIVCYNGRPIWWPSLDLAGMIKAPPGLEHLVPNLFYMLVDEHRIAEEQLDDENLLAALIGLEKTESLEELHTAFNQLLKWVRKPGIRRAFAATVQVILRRLGIRDPRLDGLEVPEEVETMLAENLMDWRDGVHEEGREKGREEGREKGREEGREKGREEGEALMLTRLVQLKFGPPDEATQQRISDADSETLLRWAGRVLTANSLSEVFNDN